MLLRTSDEVWVELPRAGVDLPRLHTHCHVRGLALPGEGGREKDPGPGGTRPVGDVAT